MHNYYDHLKRHNAALPTEVVLELSFLEAKLSFRKAKLSFREVERLNCFLEVEGLSYFRSIL